MELDQSKLDAVVSTMADETKPAAGLSVYNAASTNADESAKAIGLSEITGLPRDTVLNQYAELQRDELAKSAAALSETHPEIASWLQQPDNASIAHDDIPNLVQIGDKARTLTGAAARSLVNEVPFLDNETRESVQRGFDRVALDLPEIGKLSLTRLAQAGVGALDLAIVAGKAITTPSSYLSEDGMLKDAAKSLRGRLPGDALIRSGVNLEAIAQGQIAQMEPETQTAMQDIAAQHDFLGKLEAYGRNPLQAVYTALEQVPTILTGGVIGAGLKRLGASAIASGASDEGLMMAGQTVSQSRAKNGGAVSSDAFEQAVLAGATGALFAYGGGKLADFAGVGDVDRILIQGANASGNRAAHVAGTVAIETGEELLQNPTEQVISNLYGDKPLLEGVGGAAADALVVGSLASLPFALYQNKQAVRQQAARQAVQAVQNTQAVAQIVAASRVRGRNERMFQQFLEGQVGEDDAIYFDVSDLQEAGLVDSLSSLSSSASAQLQNEPANGGMIAIPVAEYLTSVASNQDVHGQLLDMARIGDADAMTVREAEAYQQGATEENKAEAERLIQKIQGDAEFAASETAVKDLISSELKDTGYVSRHSIDAAATLFSTFIAARASQLGITPEEMYKRNPIRFEGAQSLTQLSGIPEGIASSVDEDSMKLQNELAVGGQSPKIETLDRTAFPAKIQAALQALESITGNRVVVYRDTSGLRQFDRNGATFRDGVLYVNETAQSPVITVAAHEFVHNLEKTNPELYKELEAEIRRQGDLNKYAMELTRRGETNAKGIAASELTADAMGDALSDPVFLELLARQNETVFRKVVQALISFLDTLRGRFVDFGSDAYLSDVDAFRAVALDVLARYKGAPVTPQESAVGEEPAQAQALPEVTQEAASDALTGIMRGLKRKTPNAGAMAGDAAIWSVWTINNGAESFAAFAVQVYEQFGAKGLEFARLWYMEAKADARIDPFASLSSAVEVRDTDYLDVFAENEKAIRALFGDEFADKYADKQKRAELKAQRAREVAERKANREKAAKQKAQDPAIFAAKFRKEIFAIIKKYGGISTEEMTDITRERKGKAIKIRPGVFTKNGVRMDHIATALHERGYISDADYGDVDGGVQVAKEIVLAALHKDPVIPIGQQDVYYEMLMNQRVESEEVRRANAAEGGEALLERARGIMGDDAFDQARSELSDDADFTEWARRVVARSEQEAAEMSDDWEHADIPFSRKRVPDKKNLIIQHNMTEANLIHADRMGGLAVPSLAITTDDNTLESFGEITLLGDEGMADPKGYAKTQVFGADIYSPRYPKFEYSLGKSALLRLNKILEPFREGREIYSGDIQHESDLRHNPAFKRYAENQHAGEDSQLVAEKLLQQVGADERIFLEYTENGRRYAKHNLENVVKILKKNLRGGEGFNYGAGSLRAKYAPKFGGINKIREAKGRLISKQDFSKIKTEADSLLRAIHGDLQGYSKYSGYVDTDTVVAVLEDFGRHGGLLRALKEYGFEGVPQELQAEIISFVSYLRDMPTEYFEGKILRDVSLAEFKAALVPSDASKKVYDILEKNGLEVRTYISGDEADRRLAINQIADEKGLRFSRKSVGVGTVETLSNAFQNRLGASVWAALTSSRGGKPLVRVVQSIRNLPKHLQDAMFQRVFHGGPHRGIEKQGFKLNMIGTGEGAQAYGWGIYFASRREVAGGYRKNNLTIKAMSEAPRFWRGERLVPETPEYRASGLLDSRSLPYVRKEVRGWIADEPSADRRAEYLKLLKVLESARSKSEFKRGVPGQLYSAEIPEDSDLLDWDKPLSEQPEKVRAALAQSDVPIVSYWAGKSVENPAYNVADLYMRLSGTIGGYQAASEYLRSIGIPGLRYLDGGSRANGEGTHNYVIWDENLLTPEKAQIETFYSKNQGTIGALWDGETAWVVADNTSAEEAFPRLLHELARHASESAVKSGTASPLQTMLGENYGSLLERFHAIRNDGAGKVDQDIAQRAEDAAQADYDARLRDAGENPSAETLAKLEAIRNSERLAYFIEYAQAAQDAAAKDGKGIGVRARRWLADAIAAVKAWLVKTGFVERMPAVMRKRFTENLTAGDVAAMARMAISELASIGASDVLGDGVRYSFAGTRAKSNVRSGELPGYVSWDINVDPVFNEDGDEVDTDEYVLIDKVFVEPSQRRKGIARLLLRKAIYDIQTAHPGMNIKLAATPDNEKDIGSDELVSFYESEGFDVDTSVTDAPFVSMEYGGKKITEQEARETNEAINLILNRSTPANVGDEANRQYDAVVAAHTNPDGSRKSSWMKAPNGQPTKLNERQWVQVRTGNFKKWFGDWENDPANASKVVDENGEPMVVYHQTGAEFTVFDGSRAKRAAFGAGHYFTTDVSTNKQAATVQGDKVIEAFLNVRKPAVISDLRAGMEAIQSGRFTFEQQVERGRAVTEYLSGQGFDGVEVDTDMVAFRPNQIKSAIGNVGTFSQDDDDIRYSRKGSDYNPESVVISMTTAANASNLLHDAARFFFDTDVKLARHILQSGRVPEAGEQEILNSVSNWLDWLGIQGDPMEQVRIWDNMPEESRERALNKTAQTFESYLFNASAPTLELKAYFQKYRAWLIGAYVSVDNFTKRNPEAGEITPQVRMMFDRLMATQAQIQQQEQMQEMAPLFEVQGDLSDDDYRDYLRLTQIATGESEDALQAAALRDMQYISRQQSKEVARLKRESSSVRKDVMRGVQEQVDALRVYQAWQFIAGKGGQRLDAGAVSAAVHGDETIISALRANRMLSKKGEAGADPHAMAARFGYDSDVTLLTELARAEKPRQLVQRMTDARMLMEHGELSTPEGIQRLAREAVYNKARLRVLATEDALLNKQVGSVRQLIAQSKDIAQDVIAKLTLRQIRPNKYQSAATQAGKKAAQAFAKGDRAAAARHKRDQIMQTQLAMEAVRVQKLFEAGVRRFNRLDKAMKKGKSGISPDYMEQIAAILDKYAFKIGDSKARENLSFATWVESQIKRGVVPYASEHLLSAEDRARYHAEIGKLDENGNLVVEDEEAQLRVLARYVDAAKKQPIKSLTAEQFAALVEIIDQIEHLGRTKDRLLTSQRKRKLSATIDAIVSRVREVAKLKGREAKQEAPATKLEMMEDAIVRYGIQHVKAAIWAQVMDGGEGGILWETAIRSANERSVIKTEMTAQAAEALTKILEPFIKDKSFKKREPREVVGRSMTKEQIFMVALNMGNESNLERLLNGYKWTHSQAVQLISALSESELRAVEQVWKYFETFVPAIRAKEMRVYGRKFETLPPQPLVVRTSEGKIITLSGGYIPAKYDAHASSRATEHEAEDAAKRSIFSQQTTRRTFTKSRVKQAPNMKLSLSLNTVYDGIGEVIHDIAWGEWLIDMGRVFGSRKVQDAIRETYGKHVLNEFMAWKDAIREDSQRANHAGEAFIGAMGRNVGLATLGMNVWTMTLQTSGIFMSIPRVGGKFVLGSLRRYMANPLAMHREAVTLSGEMRNRARTMFREINEIRGNLGDGRNQVQKTIDAGYILIQKMQSVVDVITWHGAYTKFAAQGFDEDTVIAMADQAVIDAQGGGALKDRARVERGGPVWKLFTIFGTFLIAQLNLVVRQNMLAKTKQQQVIDNLMLLLVPTLAYQVLKSLVTPGGGDDDWDEVAKKFAAELASDWMSLFVGLREFAAIPNILIEGEGFSYRGPAGLSPIVHSVNTAMQVSQGEPDMGMLRAILDNVGDFTGVPSGQIKHTIQGYNAMVEGKTYNPLALLYGYEE